MFSQIQSILEHSNWIIDEAEIRLEQFKAICEELEVQFRELKARLEYVNATLNIIDKNCSGIQNTVIVSDNEIEQDIEEATRRFLEELANEAVDSPVEEDEQNEMSCDLQVLENAKDSVQDRSALIYSRDFRLAQKLKLFAANLAQARDKSKETQLDKLHRQKYNKDKYSLLRCSRKGDTRGRIAMFENM